MSQKLNHSFVYVNTYLVEETVRMEEESEEPREVTGMKEGLVAAVGNTEASPMLGLG